jgi:DNA-binding CsgD family transcriptional regulator/tetratricopeptide (TPR) repeat protein
VGSELLERHAEQGALQELVESARAGRGVALVVVGEAGIGKSALLDHAVAHAAGLAVLRASGVEAEMDLSYAGLHRLLRPHLDRLPALPPPQRAALETVFGLELGAPTDGFLVGLATLTLLTDLACDQPVLCVVDDVHWLDQESLGVLAFVARRVLADRIALVFARRDGSHAVAALDGLPTLPVARLSEGAAHELLRSVATTGIEPGVGDRIVAEAVGNPLAIVELASDLAAEGFAVGIDPLQPLPLGRRLEARFAQVVHDLPADAQRLLLLAAAEPTGDPALLRRAADALGLAPDAVAAVEDAGLLHIEPSVLFRHPLIRSAVYGAAGLAARREAHGALASVDLGAGGADMRAWHLGLAVAEPDDAVAAELESSAARVRARSGYTAEAAFLTRAAELTSDPHRRTGRLLAAAAAAAGGGPARARPLLDTARAEATDDGHAAFAQWLHGLFLLQEGRYGEAPAALLAAARAYEGHDQARARLVLLDALGAVGRTGDGAVGTTPLEIATVALATPRPAGATATMADLLLDGIATRIAVGYAEAVPTLRAAVRRWAPSDVPSDNLALMCVLGTDVALDLLDDRALGAWVDALERHARHQGANRLLRTVLYGRSTTAGLRGRFAEAASANSESKQLNLLAGAPDHLQAFIDVELLGLRGDDAAARTAVRTTRHMAAATGFDAADGKALHACARLDVASGDYASAFAAAASVAARMPLGTSFIGGAPVLPDLVEAAARSGEVDAAHAAVERLADRAQATGTRWARGLLARSRALLASDAAAEELYGEALDHLAATTMAFDLARTQLVHGEWLRRQNRRIDARVQLRAAAQAFGSMGADGFADRAHKELVATGERARRRTVDTAHDLTPQERQIAELAAQRVTNREIAARLFISARTVDYHLRNVFLKLDVGSRRQLGAALRPDPRRRVGSASERPGHA